MEITIATSIAPHNIELQKKALASWKKIGFNIIAVNSPEEIKLMKETFNDVTFVETERSASALLGKSFVYFDDVLKALEATGSPICGIVNSDIHLIAGDDFLEYISDESRGSFILGSRVDVTSLSCLEGEYYVQGFDFFFFDRAVIKEYMQTAFCLGAPWWDYWAPGVPILKGFAVKHLIAPVAYHIRHPAKWHQGLFFDFGAKLINYLKQEDLYKCMGEDLLAAVETRKHEPDILLFSICMINYINQKSFKIFYYRPEGLSCDDKISINQYQAIKEELAFQKSLHKKMNKLLIDRSLSLESNLNNIGGSLRRKLSSTFAWIFNSLKIGRRKR